MGLPDANVQDLLQQQSQGLTWGGGTFVVSNSGNTANTIPAIVWSNASGEVFVQATIVSNVILYLPTPPGGVGTIGLVQAVEAGTQTGVSSIVFANSHNLSFGMSGSSQITASYNFNVSAGTTSNNLISVSFGNANGISFGLATGTITASYAPVTFTAALRGRREATSSSRSGMATSSSPERETSSSLHRTTGSATTSSRPRR